VASCKVDYVPASNSVGTNSITASYGGDTNHAGSNNNLTPFALSVQATTSLLYTGDETVVLGSTLHLSATLSSVASACTNGKTITFTLDANPITGAPGSYTIGTAGPTSSGSAATTNAMTNWVEGVYTLTARFAGDTGCLISSDYATLTVGGPGSKATGGGFVSGNGLPNGVGRINFGFVVDLVPNTTNQYKGQFVLVNPDVWRFKGNFGQASGGTYAQTGTSGSGTGMGTLYHWNGTTWVVANNGSNVTFTISFTDNGSGKKQTAPDAFGIHMNYDPVANGYTDPFPNFSPIGIKGGNITVSSS